MYDTREVPEKNLSTETVSMFYAIDWNHNHTINKPVHMTPQSGISADERGITESSVCLRSSPYIFIMERQRERFVFTESA